MSKNARLRMGRQNIRGSGVFFEALESRQLLSASALAACIDVTGSVGVLAASVAPNLGVAVAITTTMDSSKIPGTVVLPASGFNGSIACGVTNSGTDVTPAGASVVVSIYLRPAGTNGGSDVLIGSKGSAFAKVKGITGTKKVAVDVTIVGSQAAGDYTLVAKTIPTNFMPAVLTDVVGAGLHVTTGFTSLSNSIASSNLPGTITASTKSAVVQVTVVNTGNLVTGKTSQVTVTVTLQPTGGGTGVTLGSKTGKFKGVAALTGSVTISVSIKLKGTIAAGSYTVQSTTTPIGFTATANNVVTGASVSVAAASSGGTHFLGNIGNTITLTDLIDTNTQVFQGLGSTTSQHWHFIDNVGNVGEVFAIINLGKIAQSTDASLQFFAGGIFTQGSVNLKGKDASKAYAVGTQLTFGTSGSIACTIDSFTNGTCKVARVN